MPTIFPGAAWVPIPGCESRARRRKGRGIGLHIAVYLGPSIAKIDQSTGNDSHLYVRRDGSVEQNVDLDVISYAMVDGNATLVTVETEGGADPSTVETEPWTPAQCATLARICRWVHDTEGAPLQPMPDSRPQSRGVGYHRQGVNPWRVPGGEVWSTHYGKTCPGAAKIAQIPGIIQLATTGDDVVTTADIEAISDRTVAKIADSSLHPWSLDALLIRIMSLQTGQIGQAQQAAAILAAIAKLSGGEVPPAGAEALATALVPLLVPALAKAIPGATENIVETALRNVLGGLDNPAPAA